ncbi:unnamed protein product [Rhizophagus irregularis]|nr:unnamed protein product [Rhizophagus irregularis]
MYGRTWTWTSERLGRLEFRKGTPAWNSISAWAIKVSWGRVILIFCLSLGTSLTFLLLFFFRRRTPGFGFHKGDALPDLDFIKVTPFLDLDFGLGYQSDALPGSEFRLGLLNKLGRVTPFLTWISAWAIKVTPFLTWISAWAIKVSWGGDALPGSGFWLGLLKRTPLGPGFWETPSWTSKS